MAAPPPRHPPPDLVGDLEVHPPPTMSEVLDDNLPQNSGAPLSDPCHSPAGDGDCSIRGTADDCFTKPAPFTVDVDIAIKSYCKVVLVGDSGVGKSSFISRFSEVNPLLDCYVSSSGIDIKIHAVEMNGITTKLQIWDSSTIRTIIGSYCQGAHGIIVVYDVTDKDSFNNVREWLKQSICCASSNAKAILVGNKCDLSMEKVVSYETAKAFAEEIGIPFMETSSFNAPDVERALVAMFSAMTYRNWSCLNSDLLVKIFNGAAVLKPEVRSLMVRVCRAWKKTIFSTPPWPTILCPVILDEELRPVYDQWVPRPFEFVDPIRNIGPIHIGMRLIGCEENSFLFVDSLREPGLVLWTLLSETGKADLEQHEVFLKLPNELLAEENIYLGCSVCINGIGRRVILAGESPSVVLAATFSQGGDLLESWTIVAKFQERRFVSMVFYDGTAFLLDCKGDLCSVSWESSRVVLYERSVSSIEQSFLGHASFNLPHQGGSITSWLITLPGTTEQDPDRLACLNFEYEVGRSGATFWASHLTDVEVNGLMAFKELRNLGTSTVLLSDSRCIPLVVRKPKAIGYHEGAVFCFSQEKEDGLFAYGLHEYIEFFNHLEFKLDWPFSFFAVPGQKEPEAVPESEKSETSASQKSETSASEKSETSASEKSETSV